MKDIDPQILTEILSYDRSHPLLFNTGLFLLLFLAFIMIYQMIRRYNTAKMVFVILFSMYFYYKSSAEYCFILLGVCLSDYLLGRWMGVARDNITRRVILVLNILINVGLLVYFKYFNLLYETICNFTSTEFDALNIIIPAGISFFTFRSISYLVDIYRGDLEPADNLLEYMFFLTYFPPLLAGPVVRAKDMLPQIKANPIATKAMVSEGLFLIMAGLIKKVIVADYLRENLVARVFENPSLYTGLENLTGSLGYILQIYCDFSGYSDMAIGIALLMGYRFKENFRTPYKAQNPTDFWRRWHISLSSWLLDYLYIPMGGNRKGKFRQYVNLITTMLIGGIWHGANWMYLLWGGYNGALLVGHKALKGKVKVLHRNKDSRWVRAFNVFVTFIFVGFGMIMIGVVSSDPHGHNSFEKLGQIFTAIFTNFQPEVLWQFVSGYTLVVIILIAGYVSHFLPDRFYDKLQRGFGWLPYAAQAVILALVIFIVIQASQTEIVPFIYMQY